MAYMTAVIYARYSSNSQREESIEGQIRECRAFAEKNGYTIIHNYMDRAISGKTDDRPQFQRMIANSKKKLFADEETATEESGSDTNCFTAFIKKNHLGWFFFCCSNRVRSLALLKNRVAQKMFFSLT